jgi:hypothetical protein
LVPVTWPPQPPFTYDPFKILDKLIQEKAQPRPKVIGEEAIEVKTVDVVKAPKA